MARRTTQSPITSTSIFVRRKQSSTPPPACTAPARPGVRVDRLQAPPSRPHASPPGSADASRRGSGRCPSRSARRGSPRMLRLPSAQVPRAPFSSDSLHDAPTRPRATGHAKTRAPDPRRWARQASSVQGATGPARKRPRPAMAQRSARKSAREINCAFITVSIAARRSKTQITHRRNLRQHFVHSSGAILGNDCRASASAHASASSC